MVEYKVLTTILPSGTNTATFTDALIGSETKIDVYTTDDDTIIENQEQSGTTVTITVSNHSDALGIALVINNVEEYSPIDISGIISDLAELTQEVMTIDGEVASLQADKQNRLTPGENITIVNDVISATGGGSANIAYGTTEEFNAQKDSADVGTTFLITDDVIEKQILTKTITGTTNANGNIYLELNTENHTLLSIIENSGNSYTILPMTVFYNNQHLIYGNCTAKNTNVNVEIVYINKG